MSARMPIGLKRWLATAVLSLGVAPAVFAVSPTAAASLAGLPLYFEPGAGRSGSPAQFLARGENCQFVLTPAGVQFVLWKWDATQAVNSVATKLSPTRPLRARAARMEFVGANHDAGMRGAGELPGKINYLLGNDPQLWRTGLPTYARVRVEQLYPGIDLVYYGNPRQLEYDFDIAPRTDPAVISLRFDGVDELSINAEGDLVLKLGEDQIRHQRPALYQLVGGKRCEVTGGYRLKDKHTIGFVVGAYDREQPLVIDPTFSYSTYFGGNNADAAYAVKVDASGAAYIAGATLSSSFLFSIPTNAFQSTLAGGTLTGDAFVAKLDRTGTNLVYFTYLGGANEDAIYDLALDSAGNAYIAGTTDSANFPTKNPLFPKISGNPDPDIFVYPNDAFVAELNTNGSALVFSTYLGGSLNDVGSGVAVDPAGNTYVTGFTTSTNFPTTNAFQTNYTGGDDAFVVKIAPGGTNLVYATYLGGSGSDRGQSIVADESGFAYITGYTFSTNFPNANVLQTTNNGSADAFVTRLNPDGTLAYSTYLGGSYNDFGTRIALDSAHNVLVTGTSQSTNFPQTVITAGLTNGQSISNAVNYDVFVARVGVNGNLLASTTFGGTGNDSAWGIAVDAAGRVFIAGITSSFDFPVTNVFGLFATNLSGGRDVFVTALSSNFATTFYSGYLGGYLDDLAYSIAVDSESSAYVTGITGSTNFPTASPYQASLQGPSCAFLAKIRLFDPTLTATLAGGNFILQWPVTASGYALRSALSLSPPVAWTTVSQTPVLGGGWYTVTLPPTNALNFFRLAK